MVLLSGASVYLWNKDTPSVAIESLALCFTKNIHAADTPNPECLKEAVHNLLNSYSATTLFSAIQASTTPDIVRNNCHAIGHMIGRETFARSDSLENALSICSRSCYYACTHGVIGAAVLKELGEEYNDEDIAHMSGTDIERLGKKYCNDSVLCHAVGHLLYMSYQDFPKALDGCDAVSTDPHTEHCYQGVFMEGLGSSESLLLSATTSPHTDNNYAYPCTNIKESAKHACLLYLPLFQKNMFTKHKVSTGPARVTISEQTCQTFVTTTERADCFTGIGYRAKMVFLATNTTASSFCNMLGTAPDRVRCTLGVTLQFLDNFKYPTAAQYCASQSETQNKSICYSALFQVMEKRNESIQGTNFCNTTNTASECKEEYTRYLDTKSFLPDYKESF